VTIVLHNDLVQFTDSVAALHVPSGAVRARDRLAADAHIESGLTADYANQVAGGVKTRAVPPSIRQGAQQLDLDYQDLTNAL
jgi:hypothetical protein